MQGSGLRPWIHGVEGGRQRLRNLHVALDTVILDVYAIFGERAVFNRNPGSYASKRWHLNNSVALNEERKSIAK